jgi:hypothetical protein
MTGSSDSRVNNHRLRVKKLLATNRPDVDRDAQLELLLSELALLLLPAGITPMHFAEIAKHAFVHAAGQISSFRNGKFNQSRIAVITGLNRSEVKKLLHLGRKRRFGGGSRLARTDRVISGWVSDRRFLDRKGKPRKLRIQGENSSFSSLVRAFAGDVPYRAVLNELKRTRSVLQAGDWLQLDTRVLASNSRLPKSFSQVLPALLDGIHLAALKQKTRAIIPMYRLTLAARDSAEMAILRERFASGAQSMINGLGVSLERRTARPRRDHTITITTFIRERTSLKRVRGAPPNL